MTQAHLTISGSVQGIGYRYFVKSNATRLGLTGWVRNNPDGTVEALLQGEKEPIEQMVALCKKGPFLAEIKDIKITWEETKENFTDFTILPSSSE